MWKTNKLTLIIGFIAVCFMAACSQTSLKQPTSSERAREVSRIRSQLALEYFNMQDFRQAVSAAEEAVRADAQNETAWLVRAQIAQELKQYDKAEHSLQTALKLNPQSAEANNNYGWFLCEAQNRPHDAMPYFDQALADPTYPAPYTAYLNKGICSGKMGQTQLAKAYLEKALNLLPYFPAALRALSELSLNTNQAQEAERYFLQYQQQLNKQLNINILSPRDFVLAYRIAQAQNKTAMAKRYEELLQQHYPYSPEWQNLKGVISYE